MVLQRVAWMEMKMAVPLADFAAVPRVVRLAEQKVSHWAERRALIQAVWKVDLMAVCWAAK